MDEALSRLRREAELSPDDPLASIRFASALARASDPDGAARIYMKMHAVAPALAIDALAGLLAGGDLRADDAAWLWVVFAGHPNHVPDRSRDLARAFARRAAAERARSVLAEVARFPDRHAASVLAACAREAALGPDAGERLSEHRFGPRFRGMEALREEDAGESEEV